MATSQTHQLAAIMFSDIVGYTALMGRDEERGYQLLQKNREIQKPLIEKHHGIWIKEMGDGMMARFDSAYNAARCAIEIQQKASKEFKGRLRIGLHLGDILVEGGDIFGDDVNIASRIESIADPGGIYVSEPVHKALQSHADIHTKFLGPVELKNVQQEVKIYYLTGYGLATPSKKKIGQIRKVRQRNVKKNRVLLLVLLLLAILSALIVNYWLENHSSRKIRSLAVLPFDNFTGSLDEQYFVDMIHDAVITELSQISKLIIRSRTSTKQFKNTTLSIPEIARILNVDAVIESSVFKTGDSVYLNVQLIQTRPEEEHIWAEDFKRDTRHILSLYGDLAKMVAREVHVQLSPMEDRLLSQKKEVDPEAYKAYLNGQFHWNKLTREDLDLAEQYFLKAIRIDPEYAEAHLGLSGIGGGRAQMGLITSAEAREQGEKHLEKALQLDSSLWEAHRRLAFSNIWWTWDFKKGMREFRTTLQLNPNDAMTRAYYAQALCIAYRDYEQAEKEGDYAIQIDPIDNLYKGLYGQTLNLCRKYDKAERIFKEVLDSDPFNAIALSNLKTTYHMQEKYTEAIEVWKIDNRKDSLAVEVLESGFESNGYSGALQAFAEYSIRKSSTEFVTPWRIFTIYVRVGLLEESLGWLEKAYEIHDPNVPYISTDPIFDVLRDHPRFQEIVKKMNFPNEMMRN